MPRWGEAGRRRSATRSHGALPRPARLLIISISVAVPSPADHCHGRRASAGLLASRLAESFAISIVVFAGDSRTGLRQPPVSDRIFQSTTLGISCPYTVGEKGEATKRATAAAAGMLQPGASRGAPVEHLYREVVCVPSIFNHIQLLLILRKRLCSCQLVSSPRSGYALFRFSATVQARSGFGVPAASGCSKDRTRRLPRRPPPSPQTQTRGTALKLDRCEGAESASCPRKMLQNVAPGN
jgi:hypothetical protein